MINRINMEGINVYIDLCWGVDTAAVSEADRNR